ncbi:unnamed protein product [Cyprideis torosa]|uniref:Uncharacterized protein n=1 Tax=Cyprideis torosa TaxID=163714 RepID=A0A7R8WEA0_9CRUS|nr:unnamed protein product [Cyprideis torosa]CAG0894130.1 unnamed protein product [Cyprideis torosa]
MGPLLLNMEGLLGDRMEGLLGDRMEGLLVAGGLPLLLKKEGRCHGGPLLLLKKGCIREVLQEDGDLLHLLKIDRNCLNSSRIILIRMCENLEVCTVMTGGGDIESEVQLVPLHERWDLLKAAVSLLNAQWPRSLTARLRTLEKSQDKLPMSLLLVDGEHGVIGHARLARLPRNPGGCWIESVVIRGDRRGQGFGKKLMLAVEAVARKEPYSFQEAFVSTHDQEVFYRRCGYQLCPPVTLFGGAAPLEAPGGNVASLSTLCSTPVTINSGAPPPPPPPLPVTATLRNQKNQTVGKKPAKIFLNKRL